MNNFSRKGAKKQRGNHDRKACIAPLRLCGKILISIVLVILSTPVFAQAPANNYLFNDTHFHLTNYIQEGIDIHDFLKIMGNKAGRVALFGIPLQQQWSYRIDEDRGPTYYLNSDAPLYYYSFTDAWIATAYKSLSKADQARFDPMITGFNPTDMYAADHIRRVLRTFPGVFSGIGEFTIHKEFVSAKIAGEVASLQDQALDRLIEFAGEVGLVVLIHCDVDVPFAKPGVEPAYAKQIKALFKRHPNTTIIWAHIGVGRIIRPIKDQAALVEDIINDPQLRRVYFDISWDEVAKYVVSTPESAKSAAAIVNKHPDRFLFGTDEVAPPDQEKYLRVYEQYAPFWKLLTPDASEKVRKGNYERIFDEARRKVRRWEQTHVKGGSSNSGG
ncbi:MAG TPA: amidohydrolase family protein [Pyrinomonadaceae bacterium]|nr:amidohydrolase family protein [Pyrinomonadaceae bacterium]